MAARIIIGLLAPRCSGDARKKWNGLFRERGVNAFFDFYPTKNEKDMELRLSEMFTLGRASYIVGEEFQKNIIPFLDELDGSAEKMKRVDTVLNRGGVIVGYFQGESSVEERLRLWRMTGLENYSR